MFYLHASLKNYFAISKYHSVIFLSTLFYVNIA
nr:MAG TPA: hypothetical protein [Caudoviricetes sp.]